MPIAYEDIYGIMISRAVVGASLLVISYLYMRSKKQYDLIYADCLRRHLLLVMFNSIVGCIDSIICYRFVGFGVRLFFKGSLLILNKIELLNKSIWEGVLYIVYHLSYQTHGRT